jgi:hypothetical protein
MSDDTPTPAAEEGVLTPVQRRYQSIVDKIFDLVRDAETQNLKRYYKIGKLVDDFTQEDRSKRYGDATVETLAADLQARGVLTEVKDPRRFLFWAKSLFVQYPEWETLEDLSKRGFTVTHAKLLTAVSEDIRDEVVGAMFVDGKVLSSRALEELIREKQQAKITADANAAAAGEVAETRPDAEGMSVDPVKSLSTVEKALVRVNGEIPNTFIGIRETRELGFASDKKYDKYVKNLRSLQETLAGAKAPLEELEREVNRELQEIDDAAAKAAADDD